MGILKKLLIIFAPVVTGCYTDFNPDINEKSVVCLNAMCRAGEPIEIEVSRTWLYTDVASTIDHSVDDAQIVVSVNGQTVGEDYIAESGDRVRIDVTSKKYGEASAEITVPSPPETKGFTYQIDQRRIGVNRWKNENDQTGDSIFTQIQIDFDVTARLEVVDRNPDRQYYQLTAVPFYSDEPIDRYYSEEGIWFSTGWLNFEKEPIFSEILGTLDGLNETTVGNFEYFTNNTIKGGSYNLNLNYDNFSIVLEDVSPDDDIEALIERWSEKTDFEIGLELSRVSESLYNRAYYLWVTSEGMQNDLASVGLADPMGGYSNVSTRAGIVGAKTTLIKKINLKEFLTDAIRRALEE